MDDRYRYEEIDPRLQAQDAAELVNVRTAASTKSVRQNLVRVIWGSTGRPLDLLPDIIVRDIQKLKDPAADCENISELSDLILARKRLHRHRRKLRCELHLYRGWKNLAGLDELQVSISPEYSGTIAYYRPFNANGTLVLYHHGYAGTFHDQHKMLERLVTAGYTVAAFNLLGYGDNSCRGKSIWCGVALGKFDVPLPMRLHFSPPVATINYAQKYGSIDKIAMIGLSTGAWVTTVLSAIEPRITRSYAVAGVIPVYLQRDGNEWPIGQRYPPLVDAATMLDLFVLGASPADRRQWQIYNRYDRCCYSGIRSKLFDKVVAEAVRKIGGGQFDVFIDETHARHKISRWAFGLILRDLEEFSATETRKAERQ